MESEKMVEKGCKKMSFLDMPFSPMDLKIPYSRKQEKEKKTKDMRRQKMRTWRFRK